jgi:mevalonate kinase
MVNIFMENLKTRFRTMLKNQFVKYTDACVENFLGGMKSLFMNTEAFKVVLTILNL